jgi:hypothetical protein
MMADNEYYDRGNNLPLPNSRASSAEMRAEFDAIEAGFERLPALAGMGGKIVRVKEDESGMETIDAPTEFMQQVMSEAEDDQTARELLNAVGTTAIIQSTDNILDSLRTSNIYCFANGIANLFLTGWLFVKSDPAGVLVAQSYVDYQNKAIYVREAYLDQWSDWRLVPSATTFGQSLLNAPDAATARQILGLS